MRVLIDEAIDEEELADTGVIDEGTTTVPLCGFRGNGISVKDKNILGIKKSTVVLYQGNVKKH